MSGKFKTNKLITRFSGNPILTKEDRPYPVATVRNAAVVNHSNEYFMIFRSYRLNDWSILGLARARPTWGFFYLVSIFGTRSEHYLKLNVEE